MPAPVQVLDKGLAFYWGTSEWSREQIEEAWAVADRLGLVGPGACPLAFRRLRPARARRTAEAYAWPALRAGPGLWGRLHSVFCSGRVVRAR